MPSMLQLSPNVCDPSEAKADEACDPSGAIGGLVCDPSEASMAKVKDDLIRR